jgi:hypothetical protein
MIWAAPGQAPGVEWAVRDQDRVGSAAILLIVSERAEAEIIAIQLRQAGVRAEVVPVMDAGTRKPHTAGLTTTSAPVPTLSSTGVDNLWRTRQDRPGRPGDVARPNACPGRPRWGRGAEITTARRVG